MTAYPTVVLVNHEGVVISPELTRLDDAEDGSWRFGYMGGEITDSAAHNIKELCRSGGYSLEPYDRDKHSWQVLRGSALYQAGIELLVEFDSYPLYFIMNSYPEFPEFPEDPTEVESNIRKLCNNLNSIVLKLDRAHMTRDA